MTSILVDASVLELPRTGVGNVLLGLYQAAQQLEPSLRLRLVHRAPLATPLPSSLPTRRIGTLFSPPHWRQWRLPLEALSFEFSHFPWNGNVPRLWGRTQVITTLHDVLPLAIPNYFASCADEAAYRSRIQSDLDRSALVTTDSEYSRGEILKSFRVKQEVVVIHLATHLTPSDHRSPDAGAAPSYFIYVGGYDRRKGLELLLSTHLELHQQKKSNALLYLAGSAASLSPEFDRLLAEGLARRIVKQLGYVDDDELARLYQNALALIYPSPYEGFGLPPLEAMTCGCPVIAWNAAPLREVCGEAAIYVDDGPQLAEAMSQIESNAPLCEQLRQKGLNRASLFSWDKAASIFLELLKKTRAQRKGGGQS